MKFDFNEHPHRRYNPLTDEWILVSPHRTKRPWQGKQEEASLDNRPEYDEKCYLCPGNERMGGMSNPNYEDTFVFKNDFAALLTDSTESEESKDSLMQVMQVKGECRVICFSPKHNLTLPEMSIPAIRSVIDLWSSQMTELGEKYKWVQLFENKGAIMGCSNPHPHGQIWASDFLPNEAAKEDRSQSNYFAKNSRPLLVDYLEEELAGDGERTVVENESWIVVVPFWATWPFEVLLLPKRHIPRINMLTDKESDDLASILKQLTIKYDNLFQTSFPYSMGWHSAPFNLSDKEEEYWQLHAHFYPPLLRSATVKKFMVGYEMLAEAQRDITAEQAAERLRNLPDSHYKLKS